MPEREVVSGGGGVEYRLGTYREGLFDTLSKSISIVLLDNSFVGNILSNMNAKSLNLSELFIFPIRPGLITLGNILSLALVWAT